MRQSHPLDRPSESRPATRSSLRRRAITRQLHTPHRARFRTSCDGVLFVQVVGFNTSWIGTVRGALVSRTARHLSSAAEQCNACDPRDRVMAAGITIRGNACCRQHVSSSTCVPSSLGLQEGKEKEKKRKERTKKRITARVWRCTVRGVRPPLDEATGSRVQVWGTRKQHTTARVSDTCRPRVGPSKRVRFSPTGVRTSERSSGPEPAPTLGIITIPRGEDHPPIVPSDLDFICTAASSGLWEPSQG